MCFCTGLRYDANIAAFIVAMTLELDLYTEVSCVLRVGHGAPREDMALCGIKRARARAIACACAASVPQWPKTTCYLK